MDFGADHGADARGSDKLQRYTAAQMALHIWLRGALTSEGDGADAIRHLRGLRRAAEASRAAKSSTRSTLAEEGAARGADRARSKYEQALFAAQSGGTHAVVISLLAVGGAFGRESELGTARWLPPWRAPERGRPVRGRLSVG